MPTRSTFIDAVEVMPLKGATMHFASHSGGETLRFSCERGTAVRLAYDILAAVETADARPKAKIVKLDRTG